MLDIKKILSKKKWSGQELGILELTNMAIIFKQTLNGEKPQPIISTQQLQAMINKMDRTQIHIYNGYISIHEWISIKYNMAQAQLQQAQLQLMILTNFITQANLTEEFYSYLVKLPAIMTQKQYDQLDFNAKKNLINGVAILIPNSFQNTDTNINKHGNYVTKQIKNILADNSLEVFFSTSKDYEENTDIVKSSTQTLADSYYFLMGYNLILDITTNYCDVHELEVFKINLAGLNDRIDSYNIFLNSLKKKIKATNFKDNELYEKKYQVLKKIFCELDCKNFKIPIENIEQVKKLLDGFKIFMPENVNLLHELIFMPQNKNGRSA